MLEANNSRSKDPDREPKKCGHSSSIPQIEPRPSSVQARRSPVRLPVVSAGSSGAPLAEQTGEPRAASSRTTREGGSTHDCLERVAKEGKAALLRIGIRKKDRKLFQVLNRSAKDCTICRGRCSPQELIMRGLRKKYMTTRDSYNVKVINDVVYNEDCHIVSVFKDYLIYDDASEFMKRFYTRHESAQRLPRVYDFYEKYSEVFANYIALPESKYMFKNIERKQKAIDQQQKNGDDRKTKRSDGSGTDHLQILTTGFCEDLAKDDANRTAMQSYIMLQPKDAHPHETALGNMKLSELVDRFLSKDTLSVIDVSQALGSVDGSQTFLRAEPRNGKTKGELPQPVFVVPEPVSAANSPRASRNVAIVLEAPTQKKRSVSGLRISTKVVSPGQGRYYSTTTKKSQPPPATRSRPPSVAGGVMRTIREELRTRCEVRFPAAGTVLCEPRASLGAMRRGSGALQGLPTVKPSCGGKRSVSVNNRNKVIQIQCLNDIYNSNSGNSRSNNNRGRTKRNSQRGGPEPAATVARVEPRRQQPAPAAGFKSKFLNTLQRKHQLQHLQPETSRATGVVQQQRTPVESAGTKALLASRSASNLRAGQQFVRLPFPATGRNSGVGTNCGSRRMLGCRIKG